jgi:hypothetical protein
MLRPKISLPASFAAPRRYNAIPGDAGYLVEFAQDYIYSLDRLPEGSRERRRLPIARRIFSMGVHLE